jgi:hypothetical protein
MLKWLGVKPSYSRPRVSDDNAFSEALFRTAKYRPEFPTKGFADLDAARAWAAGFVHWYNVDHHHSGIRYVSPAARHDGRDIAILAARHALYLKARDRNPSRWSGDTRNWSHIEVVTLNPRARLRCHRTPQEHRYPAFSSMTEATTYLTRAGGNTCRSLSSTSLALLRLRFSGAVAARQRHLDPSGVFAVA